MAPLTDAEKTSLARKKVEAMTTFYIHAAVFGVVMLILFLVDSANGEGWWVQWPLLGWGTGLAAHWAFTFNNGFPYLSNWQERKVKELKDKM